MTVDTVWLQLGIAAPLVAILLYLLKQGTDERREVTTKFLETLRTTVEQSNEVQLRTANELSQLALAIRDHQEKSAEEHIRIIDTIGKLGLRERA